MEEKQMFKVETEDGVVRDAELHFVFELQENGKEYAVYSIAGPNNIDNVFGGIIVKDAAGDEVLQDLETEDEKKMITGIIDGLLSGEISIPENIQ